MAPKNLRLIQSPVCLQAVPLRPLLIMALNRVMDRDCPPCGAFRKMLPSVLQPILLRTKLLPIPARPRPESPIAQPVRMARPVFFSILSNQSYPDKCITYRHGRRDLKPQARILCQLRGLMRLATHYLRPLHPLFPMGHMTGNREHCSPERLLRRLVWKSISTRKAILARSGSMMFPSESDPQLAFVNEQQGPIR